MKVLISLAEKYQTELVQFGQTPEILARGSKLLENLQAADSTQELKKDTKNQATQDRHQQFKNLYDTVIKINQIGRLVFEGDLVILALFESKWSTSNSIKTEEMEKTN